MFGIVKVILHRPIPDGFKIKTASVTKKADSYYLTLSLEDTTIQSVKPDFNPDSITDIALGLKDFYWLRSPHCTCTQVSVWSVSQICYYISNMQFECQILRFRMRIGITLSARPY